MSRGTVTVLPAIPQFYRSLVNAELPGKLPLRICISGAAPLPSQVLKEFEDKFHVPLIEGYGLSEASPVVTKNPLDGTHKPGSIGLPIPAVEVSIQDDAGRELPHNEIGELCVRGGNVMVGYWKQPEETAKVFRGGWLLTGDIGYRDEEGYYVASVPELPGCHTQARSLDKLMDRIREAIELCLEVERGGRAGLLGVDNKGESADGGHALTISDH